MRNFVERSEITSNIDCNLVHSARNARIQPQISQNSRQIYCTTDGYQILLFCNLIRYFPDNGMCLSCTCRRVLLIVDDGICVNPLFKDDCKKPPATISYEEVILVTKWMKFPSIFAKTLSNMTEAILPAK
jgi:hypothetical protein